MKKKKIENENVSPSNRYRAICEDCSFKGNWHNNKGKAADDVLEHQERKNHITRILTKPQYNEA